MNAYLIFILAILIGEYILELIVERLNVKNASPVLPQEFEGYYGAENYRRSQNYLKDSTNYGLVKNTLFTIVVLGFVLLGGFNAVDKFARGFGLNSIATGLIFAGSLMLLSGALSIPFSAYHNFVIEEKYGFNKTSFNTFISDIVKSLILTAVIGGIIFAGIIWFFERTGKAAWLYCWLAVTLFQLFLTFVAPVVIMPMFNKFVPLEEESLKEKIRDYARSQNFRIKGIFKMDASRRSSKSNAFFTGFGKYRRVVLFDTLIKKHTVDELISIVAHEIGHYKKGHIIKGLALSISATGFMFYLLSFFINNKSLFAAFRMEYTSVYASLVFFGFLYMPISFLLSLYTHFISRRYEYQADAFAVCTYKKPQAMISALKKLTVDNLVNLTPHPLKVFFHYTHAPVMQRIEAIRKIKIS